MGFNGGPPIKLWAARAWIASLSTDVRLKPDGTGSSNTAKAVSRESRNAPAHSVIEALLQRQIHPGRAVV